MPKLTSRECERLIGSLVGGLTALADISDIRVAIKWWAENDDAWEMVGLIPRQTERVMLDMAQQIKNKQENNHDD